MKIVKYALSALMLSAVLFLYGNATLAGNTAESGVNVNVEMQHAATHRLTLYDMLSGNVRKPVGYCSGTVVGPHAILTAQHCFKNSNLVGLDDDKTLLHISEALLDGNDHVIYIVDRAFMTWTGINERQPISKELVHFWGNPGDSIDVYRDGYYKSMCTVPYYDNGQTSLQCFVLSTYKGDSGSGVFDAAGSVIAVISMGDISARMQAFPLAFTQEQLNAVTDIK